MNGGLVAKAELTMIKTSEESMLKARAIVGKWAKYENEVVDPRPTFLEALIAQAIDQAEARAEARGRLAGLGEAEKAVLEEKVTWDGQNESDKTYNMAIDHAVIAIRSRQGKNA